MEYIGLTLCDSFLLLLCECEFIQLLPNSQEIPDKSDTPTCMVCRTLPSYFALARWGVFILRLMPSSRPPDAEADSVTIFAPVFSHKVGTHRCNVGDVVQ